MVETDEEQLEVLKKWWGENGTSLIPLSYLQWCYFRFPSVEDNERETGESASKASEFDSGVQSKG